MRNKPVGVAAMERRVLLVFVLAVAVPAEVGPKSASGSRLSTPLPPNLFVLAALVVLGRRKEEGLLLLEVEVLEEERASLVKRSEIDFMCCSGGRRMWTSGSGPTGSWRWETEAVERTTTGIDCVIVVSRSWVMDVPVPAPAPPPAAVEGNGSGASGRKERSLSPLSRLAEVEGGSLLLLVLVFVGRAVTDVRLEVMIVRASMGASSFFVRRISALVAPKAERRARWR